MPKVADIRFSWKKSVSADVVKVKAKLTVDGTETSVEFGPEVEEYVATAIAAKASVLFQVSVIDSEGFESPSVSHDFVLGDLEAPQPVTDLFHEIVAIRDVDV